ncbi:hypothetical protein B296_00005918 [Ensete ventricosum]|uniref:Uncharacterized protein n=1 Tax=Ensete ventricosum TaxID=4639 RepID=A0A427AQ03_ENSVE|nr:hypothetical protein B296_00005918 [Ensete ventricosum]
MLSSEPVKRKHPRITYADLYQIIFVFFSTFLYFVHLISANFRQDEELFFKDYAESHKKLSELGFTPRQTGSTTKTIATSAVLAQSAFGVAVAAAVVILSYCYEASRRK